MKIEKTIIMRYINVEAEVICYIDEVYFYLNGILIEKDSTPPFEWNWIKSSIGKYILKVIAKAGALSKEKEIEAIAVIIY
ncbi:MAG: Ig-like domain-containing protein [Thermoplasmatales archaeon]|nr:Ig-like domain-containing protein [Thermoplasmatales archaeon]